MGTVVYQQGFQSYLESQLNEPRALWLRLSSPNPHFSQPFGLALKSNGVETPNQNDDKSAASSGTEYSGDWSSLQSLSKTSSDEKENTYVQRPCSRRALSDESLALCTENLGSESGSDATDVEDLFSQNKNLEETTTETKTLRSKKRNVSASDLPPPLTSMRGSQCIHMRPHREDGRLVMTATKAPPRYGCFQTDRSNGRLRLSILQDSNEYVENEDENIEAEETHEEEEDHEVMGMENVQRSRRCVDGGRRNRGLLNWESLCVATS